jgi:hypothetical protein
VYDRRSDWTSWTCYIQWTASGTMNHRLTVKFTNSDSVTIMLRTIKLLENNSNIIMTMLRMCAYVADLSKKTKMKVNRGVQESAYTCIN